MRLDTFLHFFYITIDHELNGFLFLFEVFFHILCVDREL